MPVVREARHEDLPVVVGLLAQLNDATPEVLDAHEKAFAAVQADSRQQLLVVRDDAGGIVATASLIVVPNLGRDGRPYAIVENVVTDAPRRGERFGELLMRHCVETARAAGCYKVSLTSRKHRADAHRFYRRLGFEATSEGFRMSLEP
jgi:ribosomal protein S18 acetylase RimI-like enzyme